MTSQVNEVGRQRGVGGILGSLPAAEKASYGAIKQDPANSKQNSGKTIPAAVGFVPRPPGQTPLRSCHQPGSGGREAPTKREKIRHVDGRSGSCRVTPSLLVLYVQQMIMTPVASVAD